MESKKLVKKQMMRELRHLRKGSKAARRAVRMNALPNYYIEEVNVTRSGNRYSKLRPRLRGTRKEPRLGSPEFLRNSFIMLGLEQL